MGDDVTGLPSLQIAIPVLNRPERAGLVFRSAAAATPHARITFLCTEGDRDEIAACRRTGGEVAVIPGVRRPGDWARKLNWAFRGCGETWMLLGADDLRFHRGWFEECLKAHEATGACVIGTNDLGNSRVVAGRHSTHPLIHRDYLECGTIDDDDRILTESYTHNFADDELVQTAIFRGTFAMAPRALVEHLHPNWGKGDDDATYRLGMRGFNADRALYRRRSRLWQARPDGRRRM